MAPSTAGKRKRGDRSSWAGDAGNDGPRPSPHRPANLNMAQHNHGQHPSNQQSRDYPETRGRGVRRQSSRGGRNGPGQRSSDTQSQNAGQRDTTAMSPPTTTTPAKEVPDPGQMNGTLPTAHRQLSPPPNPAQEKPPSPQQPATPAPPPAPYDFEYVTDSIVADWTSTGKQKLVEDGVAVRLQQDVAKLACLYQELLRSGLYGRLPPTEIGTAVKEIIGEEVASDDVDMDGEKGTSSSLLDPRALFLDTLSIVTDADASNSALKPLVFSTGISPVLMRLQLDTPILQSLGLVRDTFTRMGIRKQTNLLYRQSNYNLLREESEGYSKLLTELFTTSNNEPPSSEVVEETFERVKAMIGAFDMDVGRVLDVTLDVFAAVLVKQYRFFVKLLRASSWWPKEDIFRSVEGGIQDSGLPNWALPGSPGWVTTDEERAEHMRTNEQRDRVFWDRVREIGIRAFFEIGRKPLSEEERKKILPEPSNGLSEEELETRKWVQETGTLPPKGNRVAAQLLGFKLRFYSSRARNKSDILPDNLIYLAALLIKVGFVSLRDIYPHLWRLDESMDALKEEKMKEKADRERAARPGGGMNALMMAGALSDDTLPVPRARESEARSATPATKETEAEKAATGKEEEKDDLPEPSDQKVLLLKSLLAIGALPESLFILSKFPWLMDAYPELPEFIHRILHQCLSKVYAPLRPLPTADELREQKQLATQDQSPVIKGQIRLTQAPPRRVLRWAQLDKEDTNDGTDYRFYWDDWADNVPLCQTVDDVFALCSSFLNLSGHKIGQDPSLLTKLARIGKDSLSKDDSKENKARWQDLCKRLLLPAVSLTKANPGVVNEVFHLISFFPREVRYNMYAEWHSGQTSRLPDIVTAFNQAQAETKDVLKRLSKTNIRPMARALAKIAYANPGIVIIAAINQIESYENLIEVVVECARYFTYLGYDILTWALINSLGQKGRSRVQDGGLLTSRWLSALATFAGRAFKRYSIMDPTPVLQYVAEQLRHNNSTDLIILEQMISSMAGIITDTNFNDAQIQAMGGGEILQAQTILQLLDKRHESKTTSKRLIKALTSSKLAGRLLIAIAQERLTCIFKESDESSELKLLGNIFDEIHRVLTQYLDLLRSNLSVEEFDSFVPDLASLIKEYGIQPEVAFWIRRPSVARKVTDTERVMQEEEAAAKDQEGEAASGSKDGDEDEMETADDEEMTAKEEGSSAENDMDVDKKQEDEDTTKTTEVNGHATAEQRSASTSPTSSEAPALNPVLQELVEQVKSVLPQDTWGVVGPHFYVTFWQLSLYDVHVPGKAYEDEVERLKRRIVSIQSDRSDVSMAGTQRKEKEKKQITQLQERILEENKIHLKSYSQTRAKLQREKDRWFAGMRGKHDALNVALLEQCFIPRLLLSPIDAFYCFKVLKFLHSSGTPNFRTVGLLDQLFRDQRLTALIFLCTSKEADNLGRFLNEVLRDLSRWHADKAVYEKEAFGVNKNFPGFAKAVDPEGKPNTFLDYEDFRRLLYKWHRLLAQSLKTCLNGGEYMHIRNAISVLKAIVQYFPAVNWIGRDMLKCVNDLSQHAERDDVKIPAASLIGDLNRREKKWMLPQAFMIVSQQTPIPPTTTTKAQGGANPPPLKNETVSADKSAVPAGKPKTTPGATPQSRTPTPLNAAAAEFKPPAFNVVEGVSKPDVTTRMEVEDGEIEDAKMTDVTTKPAEETGQLPPKQPEQHHVPPRPADSVAKPPAETDKAAKVQPAASQEKVAAVTPAPESQAEAELASRTRTASSPTKQRTSPRAAESGRHATVPKRPDFDRAPASNPNMRAQIHNIPSRPFRHGDGRLPMRPDLIDDRRDRHDYPRGGRYGDHDHDRPFDPSLNDPRGHARLNDRDRLEPPRSERDFPARLDEPFRSPAYRDGRPSREPDWPDRSGRLRSQSDAFHARGESERTPREGPMPPRPIPQAHPDRADMMREHPDRSSLRDGDGHRRPESKADPRAHLPRGVSPTRTEARAHPSRAASPLRSDRGDRFSSDDRRPSGYARYDDFPTGPRSERAARGPADGPEPRQPLTGPDMAHGRLRPPETPEIPSGPRGRNPPGRAGRSASGLQQPPSVPSAPAAAGTERQPPTGPSGRRSAPEQPSPPAPASPAAERLDVSGIHPDRLKVMQEQQTSSEGPAYGGGVRGSPGGIVPPSGPRGAPSGPSPISRGPPSGPSFGGERGGRGDKRFAGINSMLQQSSGPLDRGGSMRGKAAGRQSGSVNAPSPQGTRPQTPSTAVEDANRPAAAQGRPELLPSKSSGLEEDGHGGRSRGGGGRGGDLLDQPASELRRSTRHSSGGNYRDDRERERDRERDRDRDRDRERDRDRDRERERERDRERDRDRRGGDKDASRGSNRREDYRERTQDFDRERSRRSEPGPTTIPPREERHDSRDSSSRRGPATRDEARRRDRRDRDDGSDAGHSSHDNEGRLRPPSSLGSGPSPLPPPPAAPAGAPEDDRRWGGGRSDNRDRDRDKDRERERDRDRDRDRDRNRERDRPRDNRDYNRDNGGASGGGNTHRKRGRTGGDEGGRGDGGRGGRMGNENKRPRRGA